MSYSPRYLLTDDEYNARGAVVEDGDQWIGYDTAGKKLFSRADHRGISAAAKRAGLVLVSGAWYGLDKVSDPPQVETRHAAALAAVNLHPPQQNGTPTMSIFANPREHAANPPETWVVRHKVDHGADRYLLTTADGSRVLESSPVARVAEEYRTHGYLVNAYERDTRWFAGDDIDGRPSWAEIQERQRELQVAEAQKRQAALLARPDVAAFAARFAALTDEEKRNLHAAWLHHFRLYRLAQSELSHRCGKAYAARTGDPYGYRDVLHVADAVTGKLDEAREAWGYPHAGADFVKAMLWGDLLTEDERPIFVGPWAAVMGEDGPRADLRQRTEAYVSPWALV